MKDDTLERNIDDVIKMAKEKNRHVNFKKITKAYNYAKSKHRRPEEKVWGTLYNPSFTSCIYFGYFGA